MEAWDENGRILSYGIVWRHEVENKCACSPQTSHNWTRAHSRPRFPLAQLLNSSWQIQQVKLSIWLKFSSINEDDTRGVLPQRVPGLFLKVSFKALIVLLLSYRDFSRVSQFDDWLRHVLQSFHVYGPTPVCVRSCLFQFDNWLKHKLKYFHYVRLRLFCLSTFMSFAAVWRPCKTFRTILACAWLHSFSCVFHLIND